MKVVFALVLLSGVLIRLQGQDSFESDTLSVAPSHAIKFSPFHLASFYPTIQIAYEFKVVKRVTVQIDGGYVLNYKTDESQFANKSGYKVKLEPRYYLRSRADNHGFYLVAEFYYNRVTFDHRNTQTECFDESCTDKYRRTYLYRAKYEEPGMVLKCGMVVYVLWNFFIDYNLGIGGRFIDYTFPDHIRIERNHVWKPLGIPHLTDRNTLAPFVNFRLAYRLK